MTETADECQLCIKERVKAGQKPRLLYALPSVRLDGKGRICPDCDKGAYDLITSRQEQNNE